MKVVVLGAGNVAYSLCHVLLQHQIEIVQIYSRTLLSAHALRDFLGQEIPCVNDLKKVVSDADLYIYALKDDCLQGVISQIVTNEQAWHIHTSGGVGWEVFEGKKNYGILYPFQTFSKAKPLTDWCEIPLFVVTNAEKVDDSHFLVRLARSLSSQVLVVQPEELDKLHIAGVFANNFTNYMYCCAKQVLASTSIPFPVLIPLIQQTAQKIQTLSPQEAQTGPAKRNDKTVIEKELNILQSTDKTLTDIYRLLSEGIVRNG